MAGDEWIEHRRGDGELVGWMIPRGDGFVVVDLLGRERTDPVEWLVAEETLDELGIGYLADLYVLTLDDGSDLRVRIAEVTPTSITVKKDDFGAVGAPQVFFPLGFPAPDSLTRLEPGDDRLFTLD